MSEPKDAMALQCLCTQIELLTACLAARPNLEGLPSLDIAYAWIQWNESARLALATTPREVGDVAGLDMALLDAVRAFRATTLVTEFGPKEQQSQLESAGHLFAVLQRVDFARSRFFLWDAPTSSLAIPAGDSPAAPTATATASKEQGMGGAQCTRCMGPVENGRCMSCGAEMPNVNEDAADGALDEQKEG